MHALFKNLVILIRARPRATPAHPPIVAHPAGTRLARAWPPVYCAVLFAHTRTPPATRRPRPSPPSNPDHSRGFVRVDALVVIGET